MAEKRYYWLKLKDDYFNTPKIKKLRKIAGGDTYTIIYLKMQLLSVKNGGCLYYEGIEPTFEEELALKLDEDLENVKLTLSYLSAQKLVEQTEGNEFTILEAQKSIGSESQSAKRVRQHRQRALQCNTDVTKCNTDIDIDIDIEKDIDKDIDTDIDIEKEKEIEIEKEKEYKKEKIKHKYGAYGRVLLTDKQLEKLKEDFGEEFTLQAIDRLDEYIQSNNNKNHYTDFNLVLRKAIREKWSLLADIKGFVTIESKKKDNTNIFDNLLREAEEEIQ